ncbi:Neural cell adhesion molecule 1 [Holothuria leucospilota]|uniref:Neural cell adhesion molecule 1 n=1 Tax=Holothuria leucospilota TaxID=206669 RepID=A0A9Q1CQ40_HOLLE|nr:Neural cell adhesion molecule 1 [Holothuria leucospilota]
MHYFLALLKVLSLFLGVIQASERKQNWTIGVCDSVLFSCNSRLPQNRIWEHESNVLFNDKLKLDFDLDHVKLLENYSMLIEEVTLPHEGIYRCLQDGRIITEIVLRVEVPPKMFLTMNELQNVTKISVEAGTDVTLFCHAVGALPHVNLSWTIDSESSDHNASNFTVKVGTEYQGRQLFDSVSAHTVKLTRRTGIISCRSTTASGLGNRELNLPYSTFVNPKMYISIEGIGGFHGIPVAANQPVQLVCNASAARPKSYIIWLINNQPIKSLEGVNETTSFITKDDATFDIVSTVWYRPKTSNGSITCASQFESIKEITRTSATYLTYGKTVLKNVTQTYSVQLFCKEIY